MHVHHNGCMCYNPLDSDACCLGTQVGYSSGQVAVHVVTPDAPRPPLGGLPVAHEIPVATIGTAIPTCHSPVVCLSARCLHACDLDAGMPYGGDLERGQRAAVDCSGARVLTVRCCMPPVTEACCLCPYKLRCALLCAWVGTGWCKGCRDGLCFRWSSKML